MMFTSGKAFLNSLMSLKTGTRLYIEWTATGTKEKIGILVYRAENHVSFDYFSLEKDRVFSPLEVTLKMLPTLDCPTLAHYEVVEENTLPTGQCRCAWLAVLQNGCRCGAIAPYEPEANWRKYA